MNSQENTIDGLKHLSQIHRSQFDERRKYEWKVFLTTLSLYVLTVAAVLGNPDSIPIMLNYRMVVWIFFITTTLISIIYLAFIHKAHQINKKIAELAENAIIDLINGDNIKKINISRFDFKLLSWSLFWQTITLIIFGLTAAYIISSS